MAVDLSAISTFPHYTKVTLSGTTGRSTRVTLPAGRRVTVSLWAMTADAALVLDDAIADDAAVTVANYAPLPHSQYVPIRFGRDASEGAGSSLVGLGIASGTASHVIHLVIEDGWTNA